MVSSKRSGVLGKIAGDVDRALAWRAASGASGRTAARRLAIGDGWSVADVICTFGPGDRPFEEQHPDVSIAVVVAGTFEYRAARERAFMAPGSLLLGNPGQYFECSHEHAAGDRCVAFRYTPACFERIAADAAALRGERGFRASRVPPVRALSALVTRVATGASMRIEVTWEELALQVAGAALGLADRMPGERAAAPARAVARVSDSVRAIERHPAARWTLKDLALGARLSPFHYLRTFRQLTGVTPHQFILRARLREAAARLVEAGGKVIDVALESGFEDISNFNRSFRTEFGIAPVAYRRQVGRR
ncbi:MAG TPA: AraC family transcriptional regulator [Gemmatimonadales bacterium]|nr:AraC family transcriptional regulator [Gemmatimonadales bacterium]